MHIIQTSFNPNQKDNNILSKERNEGKKGMLSNLHFTKDGGGDM